MPWQRLPYTIFLLICIGLIGACSTEPAISASPTEGAASATATAQPSTTPSPSPTPTTTQTPTLTDTATPTPTDTSTPLPSPTPTIALPVNLATAFPHPQEAITTANISQLQELAYWGTPQIWNFQITRDGKLGFVMTSAGLAVYDIAADQWRAGYEVLPCPVRSTSCRDDALTLSYDGSRFAILTRDSVQVWSLNTGVIFEVTTVSPERHYANHPVISPDGKLLAVRDNNQIDIYDVDRGQKIDGVPNSQSWDFLFSPDGSYFVEWTTITNSNGHGAIWRVSDWSKVRSLFLTPNQTVLDFTLDGSRVALQDNEQLVIYQIEEWRLRRQLKIHSDKWGGIRQIAFSPSGDNIAVWESYFNTSTLTSKQLVKVWDIPSGEKLSESEPPEGMSLLSVGDDGDVIPQFMPSGVCDGLGLVCSETPLSFHYDDSRFQILADIIVGYKPQGSLACTIQPGTAETCTESQLTAFIGADGQFYALRAASEPNMFELLRGVDGGGPVVGKFRSANEQLNNQSMAWLSADGRYLLFPSQTHLGGISYQGGDELWDFEQSARVQRWYDILSSLNVSPDGNYLAFDFWNDPGLVYSIKDGRTVFQSEKISYTPPKLAFTAAGDLILAQGIYEIRHEGEGRTFEFSVIDFETLQRTPSITIVQFGNYLGAITTSPDDSLLAVGMPDGVIRVFDMRTNQEIYAWPAHAANVTKLEFSADGSLLFSLGYQTRTFGDGFFRVWGVLP